MTDRLTINVESYLKIDGQWQTVLPGTVIDTPDASVFASPTVTTVTRGGGGALTPDKGHTAVTLRRR